jgi:hypothetical protein
MTTKELAATVEVVAERRPDKDSIPFGSLRLNGVHIWRFENPAQAELVGANLIRAILRS